MLQSFYTGLSGLTSFSKGLEQVSNNVSNMNTPGFRSKDVFYKSVIGDSGTQVGGDFYRGVEGDIRQTGNDTDLAIRGNGYFVLRQDGTEYFTRAGQFTFDQSNILIEQGSGARVAGIDSRGNLVDIDISENRYIPPVATTEVGFKGNISADGVNHNIDNVSVFNQIGQTLLYNIKFEDRHAVTKVVKDETGKDVDVPTGEIGWRVDVQDESGKSVAAGEIRYAGDGKIVAAYSQLELEIPNDSSSPDGAKSKVILNFAGTSGYATGDFSEMTGAASDGHGLSGLTQVSFDSKGSLTLTYSNGDKKKLYQVALANISDDGSLIQKNGSLFTVASASAVSYGRPEEGELGQIVGKSIELANVDLAEEFADMMIIQRGYQASSRILNVANEMIETLYGAGR